MAADSGRARAPKKSLAEHVATQREFLKTELQPALDAAATGTGHVFFVDAAHFVFGTFLCCRTGHPTPVPAVVLPKPELDRTTLGVRETPERLREIPRDL